MSNKLEQLKDMITLMLDDCDKYDYPHVCNMISDPETRKELEESILNMCKRSGISVGEAISQTERAYNPNMLDD
jgi:hypothetical protein